MLRRNLLVSSLLVVAASALAQMQMPGTQSQIQEVKPILSAPPVCTADMAPSELEMRGDSLRQEKSYLDAVDCYEAALKNGPVAILHNKIGMSYISMGNLEKAGKAFQKAIKLDKKYAEALNNLGVVYYRNKKLGQAEKYYKKALALRESASFHSNLGTVYVEQKQFDKGMLEYAKAYQLDPDVFERSSRTGISARMSSPEDRARYFFMLAKLYAASGDLDKSLLCLKKSLEDGFSDIDKVYKDAEFASLRKDQRFQELMSQRPTAIPQ
jgi:tetratricopeptide (TPR) repeat protein